MIPPDKDWLDLLSALLTPTIGAIGIYIAIQQRKIDRNRLKHELFEKRFKVYEKITSFIATILIEGRVRECSEFEFLRDTKSSSLLFDTHIKEFTSEIYKKAVDLQCLDSTLDGLEGEARKENIAKQRAIKDWFSNQLKAIESKFVEYLKLDH